MFSLAWVTGRAYLLLFLSCHLLLCCSTECWFCFSSIRTFYDADLPTTHFFKGQASELNYCNELGMFYRNKSEITSMTKCIRFKPSQLLYCQGDMDEYQNYSKWESTLKLWKMFNFFFSISSKAKLERIESLVICRHTQPSFDTNVLKNFLRLKNLYIGEGALQRFSDKMPKLETLEVSWTNSLSELSI